MSCKMIFPIIVLILGGILFVPPSQVNAQTIIIIAGMGAGGDEEVEVYYALRGLTPENVPEGGRVFQAWITLHHSVSDNSVCGQTVPVPLKVTPGLNILRLSTNGFLRVNGQEVGEPLKECLSNAQRLVYRVGVEHNANPDDVLPGFGQPIFFGATVVGPLGKTRAVTFTGNIFNPQFSLFGSNFP